MAPNNEDVTSKSNSLLTDIDNSQKLDGSISNNNKEDKPYKSKGYKGILGQYDHELVWYNIIFLSIINIGGLYGLITHPYSWKSALWVAVVILSAGVGVTGGVHRYYTHRSFKASKSLQILFIVLYSVAGHNKIFEWVRDHRVHHKYSETDADPHNSKRGLFFSHVGWLCMKKHPDVIKQGSKIDMSDILNDPLVQFADKYNLVFRILFCYLIPTIIPVYCWNETWMNAIISQWFVRYMCVLHITWSVNSFAHLYGNKPYDISINPRENFLVSFFAIGEGWHNFHHTFPWDYRASEYGKFNVTSGILNFLQKFGHVYDTKKASPELIKRVIENRASGTHEHSY